MSIAARTWLRAGRRPDLHRHGNPLTVPAAPALDASVSGEGTHPSRLLGRRQRRQRQQRQRHGQDRHDRPDHHVSHTADSDTAGTSPARSPSPSRLATPPAASPVTRPASTGHHAADGHPGGAGPGQTCRSAVRAPTASAARSTTTPATPTATATRSRSTRSIRPARSRSIRRRSLHQLDGVIDPQLDRLRRRHGHQERRALCPRGPSDTAFSWR